MACKESYKAWRKTQKVCSSCNKELIRLKSLQVCTNKYIYTKTPGQTEHRLIAEKLLGRRLSRGEVVHHIDSNPRNNSVDNLMLMSSSDHSRLHQHLDLQRVIFEKSKNENSENCWEALIAPLTTAWLETTGATVQKLGEIG
jgi:hypothetical protein